MRGSNLWSIEMIMGFISNHKLDGDIYNFTFHDIKKIGKFHGIVYYCFMEKLYVGVRAEFKDEKVFYYLDGTSGISLVNVRAILIGGLTLSIKGIENPEEQYYTFKQMVRFIEGELFNNESFKDLYLGIK
jgi:hypothetical protein